MNVLVDTHVFLWYSLVADKLSNTALDILNNANNSIYLSQISIWEMQIKHDLGKLSLPVDVKTLVEEQIHQNGFILLPIRNEHFWNLAYLPKLHSDPFDRLLVCQAQVEQVDILTKDQNVARYKVNALW